MREQIAIADVAERSEFFRPANVDYWVEQLEHREVVAVKVRRGTNQLEDGVHRLLAAERLGWTHFPVVYVDATDEEHADNYAAATTKTYHEEVHHQRALRWLEANKPTTYTASFTSLTTLRDMCGLSPENKEWFEKALTRWGITPSILSSIARAAYGARAKEWWAGDISYCVALGTSAKAAQLSHTKSDLFQLMKSGALGLKPAAKLTAAQHEVAKQLNLHVLPVMAGASETLRDEVEKEQHPPQQDSYKAEQQADGSWYLSGPDAGLDFLRNKFGELTGANPDGLDFTRASVWEAQTKGGGKRTLTALRVVPSGTDEKLDLDDLIARIDTYDARLEGLYPSSTTGAEFSFVVVFGDWQMGKKEGGGSEAICKRIKYCVAAALKRVKQLRAAGYNIVSLLVVGAGDLVEGCKDHYAQQTYGTDLNTEQQRRMVRILIQDALVAFAPYFERIDVIFVGGNHGEERKDGKSYTDFHDNRDIGVFYDVETALKGRPAYEHIVFYKPMLANEALFGAVTLPNGLVIGTFHGHTKKRSGVAGNTVYITEMRSGTYAPEEFRKANVFVTAHEHHGMVVELDTECVILQAPAMDGGSSWFGMRNGCTTKPAMLTFLAGANGVDEIHYIGWFGEACKELMPAELPMLSDALEAIPMPSVDSIGL